MRDTGKGQRKKLIHIILPPRIQREAERVRDFSAIAQKTVIFRTGLIDPFLKRFYKLIHRLPLFFLTAIDELLLGVYVWR